MENFKNNGSGNLIEKTNDKSTGETPFACNICDYRTAIKQSLKSHMDIHLDFRPKPFKCTICEQDFHRKSSLTSHMLIHSNSHGLSRHKLTHSDDKPFACDQCDRQFRRMDTLTEHMKAHNGEFTCSICNKALQSKIALEKHLRHHEDTGEIYQCKYCQEQFKDRMLLRDHRKNKHLTQNNECDICGKKFFTANGFAKHIKRHNESNEVTSLKCEFCGKNKFLSKQAFIEHTREHRKAERPLEDAINWQCVYCNAQLENGHRVVSHINKEHTNMISAINNQNAYKCPICKKFYNGQYGSFLIHYRTHIGELPFACRQCPRKYAGKESLAAHIKCKHDGWLCRHCGVPFNDHHRRAKHEKTHFDAEGKIHFKCQECPQDLRNGHDYAAHYMDHYNERPFECSVCQAKFFKEQTVESHLKIAHPGVKIHFCNWCNRNFANEIVFQNHCEEHKKATKPVEQNNLRCIYCQAIFEEHTILLEHIHKQHFSMATSNNTLNVELFTCPICEKAFNLKMLVEHYVTHKEDLDFECEHCNKKFETSVSLRRHLLVHKSNYKCKHCGVAFVHPRDRKKHQDKHLDLKGNVHFECDECSMVLKNGQEYAAHYMEHYKKLPFGCTLCDRRFKGKGGIDNHMMASHQGKKEDNVRTLRDPRKQNIKSTRRSTTVDSDSESSESESENTYLEKKNEGSEENAESNSDTELDEKSSEISFTINANYDGSRMTEKTLKKEATEYTDMPLSLYLYERTKITEEHIILIWLEKLESDVLTVLKDVQSKYFILTRRSKNSEKYDCSDLNKVEFSVKSPNSTLVPWQMYYFGSLDSINKIKDKQFVSYAEVESVIRSSSKRRSLINIIRYSAKGIYHGIKDQLRNPIVICNFVENE